MHLKDTSGVSRAIGVYGFLGVSAIFVLFFALLLPQHFVVEISLLWRAPSTLQVIRMITPT